MGSSPTRVDIFGFFDLILHIVALRQQKVVNYLLNCPVPWTVGTTAGSFDSMSRPPRG